MISLNEFEQDALKELFNLGIGRAADSLGQMIQDEVLLSVPHLHVMDREEAILLLKERASEQVAAIRQHFSGQFSGTAFLIYPEANSLELIRSLLGDETPLESLTELEQESLLEVGNIILNACLGTFANMMEMELAFELPEYLKGHCHILLPPLASPSITGEEHSPPLPEEERQVVFMVVDFITGGDTQQRHSIKGFVILLLDLAAIENLKFGINRLLQ